MLNSGSSFVGNSINDNTQQLCSVSFYVFLCNKLAIQVMISTWRAYPPAGGSEW